MNTKTHELSTMLMMHGHYSEALSILNTPDSVTRFFAADTLPLVYNNEQDVADSYARSLQGFRDLAETGDPVDASTTQLSPGFLWPYTGRNNRDLMQLRGMCVRGAGNLQASSPEPLNGRQLRVGFISSNLGDHTIGSLNYRRITSLSDQFKWVRFSASPLGPAFSSESRMRELPRQLDRYLRILPSLELDLLVFTDVGLDPLVTTLAHTRLAPVQCATWGHPETTGSPHMDYFLSSELLETEFSQSRFTEKLMLTQTLGVNHAGVEPVPFRDRDFFQIPQGPLYVCPHSPFKLSPAFDKYFAAIVKRDPEANILLMHQGLPEVQRLLECRIGQRLDVSKHILWCPPLSRVDFRALLRIADVVLDPYPFGGGQTSYECLACGTPVVTHPGPHTYGRITQALYATMGASELQPMVVDDPETFAGIACKVAWDPSYRKVLHDSIVESRHKLFRQADEQLDFEAALFRMASGDA